jgi:hypothetical protein
MSWECFEESTCKFPHSFSSSKLRDFRDNAKCAQSALVVTPFAQEVGWGQLSTWFRLVENYSGCGLTKTEDKLVALSGLIELIEVRSGKTNVAGLWEGAIPACPLWTPKPNFGTRLIPGFPSWSWASIDGAVSYDGLYAPKLGVQTFEEAKDVGWEVNVVETSNTTITLRGYLAKTEEVQGWSKLADSSSENLDRDCGDLLYDLDEHDEDRSWCIPLRSSQHGIGDSVDPQSGYPGWWVTGLIVQALDASKTRWIRRGLFALRIAPFLVAQEFSDWMVSRNHEMQLISLL